ncbi:MAG: hypothetical protein VX498_14900 [Myxococcota bacterium]|nr:hypothetical protein [Myxococcota bacterium]
MRGCRPGGPLFYATVLAAVVLWSSSAGAGQATPPRAGFDTAFGLVAYAPADQPRPQLVLPSPVLAIHPAGTPAPELRLRWNAIHLLYSAIERRQLALHVDLLLLPGRSNGGGKIRFLAGPILGLRLVAAPGLVQPGLTLGGRLGAEWTAPGDEVSLGLAVEPFFEVRGGLSGPRRSTTGYGGGIGLVFSLVMARPEVSWALSASEGATR